MTSPGVPSDLFDEYENDHSAALAAHFRDLQAGHVSLAHGKLMVIGNGRVGKTQVVRRLYGKPYDPAIKSTHGIHILTKSFTLGSPEREILVTAWDFGGQDIYHGTHGLFMRTRAIFLACWTPELEATVERELAGLEYQNRPLPYWLDYVRNIASDEVPVIAVQTRCDSPRDRQPLSKPARERLEKFEFHRDVGFSAMSDRGRGTLNDAIAEASDWLRDKFGDVVIGEGRIKVLQQIESLREADEDRPDTEKQSRWLSRAAFNECCKEVGGVSSESMLLNFLHNAGVIFYREELFGDRIIVDQAWALDAIYSIFNRETSLRQLRGQGGRFTRPLLEALVWQEFTKTEQQLFLSMMQSCDIAFTYRAAYGEYSDETEYIAVDLLPQKEAVEDRIQALWDTGDNVQQKCLDYDFVHEGFFRAIVRTVGEQAGASAVYWRHGVCAFDSKTHARMHLDSHLADDWTGSIHIQVRGVNGTSLLERLTRAIWELERTYDVRRTDVDSDQDAIERQTDVAQARNGFSDIAFEAPPLAKPVYAISYAWKDSTPEGVEREEKVDAFCIQAERRGFDILRDKSALGIGDNLIPFMDRISQSERIAVFLSDRYLKSASCMYELYQTWQFQRSRPELFLKTVSVFVLPCAKIWRPADRVSYAKYWRDQVTELEEAADGDIHLLGIDDVASYKRMLQFAYHVGDILGAISNQIQPRTFEQFLTVKLEQQV
ncbi:MAG: COR domain-containing protein [Terricaulis sp.]